MITAYFQVISKEKKSLLSTSQLPPIIQNCHQGFSELLQKLERGRIRWGGSRIAILSSKTRTGRNKIIYFRHSHMGPQLYQDQSEVQLPRKNRFPLASSRSDQFEPNPSGVYPRSTKPETGENQMTIKLSTSEPCQLASLVQLRTFFRTRGDD